MVWFHESGVLGVRDPSSGQLPGVVSTAQTWMLQSTAFIAVM